MKALVLGGGVARGFAYIGVYRKIEKQNINFDIIGGTSMGALIGALIAMEKTYDEIINILENIKFRKLIGLPTLGALMEGTAVYKVLLKVFGEVYIEDLNIPFFCIGTDIDTGKVKVFDEGRLIDALRATISVPGMFIPHEIEKMSIVDGGIINNLPVDIAEKKGATSILAFSVSSLPNEKSLYSKHKKDTGSRLKKIMDTIKKPVMYDLISRTVQIMLYYQEESFVNKVKCDINLIRIPVEDFSYLDFLKWKEIVKKGEEVEIKDCKL